MKILTKQVAKILGVTQLTIKRWRKAGTGPRFTKTNRFVLYDLTDVTTWREARKAVKR